MHVISKPLRYLKVFMTSLFFAASAFLFMLMILSYIIFDTRYLNAHPYPFAWGALVGFTLSAFAVSLFITNLGFGIKRRLEKAVIFSFVFGLMVTMATYFLPSFISPASSNAAGLPYIVGSKGMPLPYYAVVAAQAVPKCTVVPPAVCLNPEESESIYPISLVLDYFFWIFLVFVVFYFIGHRKSTKKNKK